MGYGVKRFKAGGISEETLVSIQENQIITFLLIKNGDNSADFNAMPSLPFSKKKPHYGKEWNSPCTLEAIQTYRKRSGIVISLPDNYSQDPKHLGLKNLLLIRCRLLDLYAWEIVRDNSLGPNWPVFSMVPSRAETTIYSVMSQSLSCCCPRSATHLQELHELLSNISEYTNIITELHSLSTLWPGLCNTGKLIYKCNEVPISYGRSENKLDLAQISLRVIYKGVKDSQFSCIMFLVNRMIHC